MQKYANISPCCKRSILALIAVLTLLCGRQRLEADIIIINDGMSNELNYSFGFFNSSLSNPDDISSMNRVFLSPGGNPGGYLEVTHNHDVTRDGNDEPLNGDGLVNLYSFFIYSPTTYNPSVSGFIQTLSFSVDIRYETNQADFSQMFFSVQDQNAIYLGAFTNISTDNGWQTITVSGLTGLDFPGRDFSGSLPLSFGFGFYSNVDVFGGPTSSVIQADNFVVSITTIPEPSSFLLLGPLMMLAAGRRRIRL